MNNLDRLIRELVLEAYTGPPKDWANLHSGRRMTARQYRAHRRLIGRLNRMLPRADRVKKGARARNTALVNTPAPQPAVGTTQFCPNSSRYPSAEIDADGWCHEHAWDCQNYALYLETLLEEST